ncbi:ADP-ribosylglycohydrolase family protein [Paraburkholderia madseniana]|uniref:ADP-ribosylglycohydrolase family protein n=1 Tax=Paraburkholderia madseniana TaxID=2599607 RepID=UPI0038BB5B89
MLRSFPKTDQPRGTGYVIDTIWSASRALEEDSFEHVVRAAILVGYDTDTAAAVACGLAGIKFGLTGIRRSWPTIRLAILRHRAHALARSPQFDALFFRRNARHRGATVYARQPRKTAAMRYII